MARLRIHEIFQSIPDHGPFSGKISTFVSLAEGTLVVPSGSIAPGRWTGERLDTEALLSRIPAEPPRVVVSHADAADFEAIRELTESLLATHRVAVVADGPYPLATLPAGVTKVVELYGPSEARFREPEANLFFGLEAEDRLRFFVRGEEDARWVNSLCIAHDLWTRAEVDVVPLEGLGMLEFINFPSAPSAEAEPKTTVE